MAENDELKHKIAALAGRINRHKAQQASSTAPPPPAHSQRESSVGDLQDSTHLSVSTAYEHSGKHWAPIRGTPYGAPRGRGGYNYRTPTHKNRTLVVNKHAVSENPQTPSAAGDGAASTGWVTKRDRHMQLINTKVYDQKVQERTQAMAETRRQKEKDRDQRQKTKIERHLRSINAQDADQQVSDAAPVPYVNIDGIRFIVADGGSKLIRGNDESNVGKTTPKHTSFGGVAFVRSKHGNLYRSGLIKTMRTRAGAPKSTQLCPAFCSTDYTEGHETNKSRTAGTCPKGPACHYTHEPEKTAICREYLSGKCTAGEYCDLSHDPTPERVPSCLHFTRGNCTNAECKYPHVRVNPGAPVCRAFAVLGYCSKGASCTERHVHECPDYSNKGLCRNKKCRLPHVDRAGLLRKAAAQREHSPPSDDNSSGDISSDGELDGMDSDDVDSDGFEMLSTRSSSNSDQGQLSQQRDFVKF